MIATNGRAVGVLDTEPQAIDRKDFDTLRARFARRGFALSRVFRAGDGRPTYHVNRSTQTRVFSHPHDVGAFLASVEGYTA